MAVKVRLRRMGKKNRDFFRVAVMDSRTKRDGRVIEELGYYDPIERDPEKAVKLDLDRARYWLGVGAQPTDMVASLLRKQGVEIVAKPVSRKPKPKLNRAEAKKRAKAAAG